MKVMRYFKDEKLVEEKVDDNEQSITKKIYYVDLPDGSSIVRETYYDAEGNLLNVTDFKYNQSGVLMFERITYPDTSFIETKYNEKGDMVQTLSVYDNALCNLATCEYDEHGNMLLSIHYAIDDGDIFHRDIRLYKNIYTAGNITEGSIVIDDDTSVCTCVCTFDSKCRCIKKEFQDSGVVEYSYYYGNSYHIREHDKNGNLKYKTIRKEYDNTSEESSWCYDDAGNTVSSTNKIFKDNKISIFEYFDGNKHTRTEYEYDEHGNTTTIVKNGVVDKKYINIYE